MKELSKEKTMTSREIAEYTGKAHNHVTRDIREMNKTYKQRGMTMIGHTQYINDQNGQTYKEYHLNKVQCFDILTGYKKEIRMAIVRKWQELETKHKIPQTYGEALLEAGRLAVENERLAIENQKMRPKAELADQAIRDMEKHYSITDAGKHLNLRQSRIFDLMREKGLLTKKRLPTQKAIDMGVLSLKTNVVDGHNRGQAVMTMENIYNFKRRYLWR